MSATGAVQPEKLGLGDVLTTTAQAIGARIGPFLVIAVLGAAPGSILMQVMNHMLQGQLAGMAGMAGGRDPEAAFGILGAMMAVYAGLLAALALHMVLIYAAEAVVVRGSISWMMGKSLDLGQMVREAGPRLPSVFGIVLVRGILQFALMMPGALIGIVMMMGAGGIAGAAGSGGGEGQTAAAVALGVMCSMPIMFVLMIVPVFIMSILLFVAEPVAVHEKLGPVDSISRSVGLTRGNRSRIFLLILAVGSAFLIVSCGLGLFSAMVTLGTGGFDPASGMTRAPSLVGSVVGALVNTAMYTVQVMTFGPLTAVIYGRLAGLNAQVDAKEVAEVFA